MKTFPKARRDKLIVQELPDEILVYDLERDKAHCLNQTAALVWKNCDGHTDAATIARRLGNELKAQVDERLVWLALDQLGRDRLLEETVVTPAFITGLTRREIVRALGLAAAVAVPVITSIVAPMPAQAVSCVAAGGSCTAGAQCCSGVCDNSNLCT